MSANVIETLRQTVGFFESCIRSGEHFTETVAAQRIDADAALAAVEALVEAAKRVDDLSEGPIHDFDALWSACEELHRVIRRVETGQ